MSYLVDTNGWIAFFEDSPVLSDSAAEIIEAGFDDCYVSIASIWEAAIKVGIGKLKLPYDLKRDLPGLLEDNGLQILSISVEDSLAVTDLAAFHGDPFDRIQVAQAQRRNWQVISRDGIFDRYGLTRIW